MALELRVESLRSLAAGSIGASYTAIGTRFTHPIRILYTVNLTDALLTYSFDGLIDHFVLPAGGFMLWDVTSNRDNINGGYYISNGTQMYVKQNGVPTTGATYITATYLRGVSQ